MATLFKHPEYTERAEELRKLKDLYEGKHKELAQPLYLWQYDLETTPLGKAKKFYDKRAERSRYTPLVKLLVEVWSGLFFRKDPVIDEATMQMLGTDIDDIDGNENTLITFIKDYASLYDLIYGSYAIVIDAFQEGAQTEAERVAKNLRPYLQIINPLDIVDWQRETKDPRRLNKLNFFRYEWLQIEPRESSSAQPMIRRWSKEYCRKDGAVTVNIFAQAEQKESDQTNTRDGNHYEEENHWELIEEVPLDQDEIPVVFHQGESWISPVVDLALRHFNLESALDNINYYAGNPLRYFTGFDGGAESEDIAISEYNVLTLPDGATAGILEPSEPVAIQKRILETRDLFFKIGLKEARALPSDSRAAQSSDSKREERDNLLAVIQSRQENLEQTINQALQHYGLFKSQDIQPEVKLQYDITQQDLEQTLSAFGILRPELQNLPMARKELVEAVIAATGIELSEEALDEVRNVVFQSGQRPLSDNLNNLLDGE